MPLAADLFRALGALCETPHPAHARLAAALGLTGGPDAADHTDLFVLQLVPYASAYLSPEGMLGGETADRVAGFWRALRLSPPGEPDHLAALLGLYASLADHERDEREPARVLMWRQARTALLWEHLLTWIPAYTAATMRVAGPFLASWARLLGAVLHAEAQALPAPPANALHLRDRTGPAGPGRRTGPAGPRSARARPQRPAAHRSRPRPRRRPHRPRAPAGRPRLRPAVHDRSGSRSGAGMAGRRGRRLGRPAPLHGAGPRRGGAGLAQPSRIHPRRAHPLTPHRHRGGPCRLTPGPCPALQAEGE
jgi:TorA maturation chaperone TorD